MEFLELSGWNPPDFLTWLAGKPTSWRCISPMEKWWFSIRNSDFSLKQCDFPIKVVISFKTSDFSMKYVLLNIVHGDFPASHVFGKEFRPRIEWICVCYKWVALDCFEILGINGQVINTPIGLFLLAKETNQHVPHLEVLSKKKGPTKINIFNCAPFQKTEFN